MLSYVAIMSPFVREDFPTPAEQAIMRRSRPMASSSFNLCFLCPRALTWSSFLLSGMFATKSLLFNDLLASVASTAHIYAHIPVYFGELIYIVFWCFCFHVSHYFVFSVIITSTDTVIKLLWRIWCQKLILQYLIILLVLASPHKKIQCLQRSYHSPQSARRCGHRRESRSYACRDRGGCSTVIWCFPSLDHNGKPKMSWDAAADHHVAFSCVATRAMMETRITAILHYVIRLIRSKLARCNLYSFWLEY
jgi:hypothetical protein